MKRTLWVFGLVLGLVSAVSADTFRHKATGEVFYGFQTQKRSGGKVLVYNSDEKKSQTIEENLYEITLDSKGRRDSIVRVPIRQADVLLSKAVSDRVAQSIIEASNSGPQFIVVEIDSPGGRGEYMRTIATAIEQTTNCPVVAYITGGGAAGAFSAAAVIALACDAVYIAPTAAIGAVGPMSGATTNEQFAAYLNLYSSDFLAAYGGYAMGLVRDESLRLLARALVDKSVSVVEVVETDGTRKFVERENRQPTQTIVRTLAEGVSAESYRLPTGETASGPLPAEVIGRALTLTASEAVRIGLIDREVASLREIAVLHGAAESQFVQAPSIDATLRQFTAARRNIGQGLSVIERLEDYASRLEEQIARVEDLLRTGTVTREVSRGSMGSVQRRGRVRLPGVYDEFYGIDGGGGTGLIRERTERVTSQTPRTRRQPAESERFTTDQPNVSLEVLRMEQAGVLRELTAEYRRVINLARRWPGGLPQELPLQVLESNMNSAAALLDNIIRFGGQTYSPSATQRVPAQGTNRR